MFNGCTPSPAVQLLSAKVLDFPSASGIEFYRDTLYVFGDNTTRLLLLTPDHQPLRSVVYVNSKDSVLSKDTKPDIESAMMLEENNKLFVFGVGSMSGRNRWTIFTLETGNDTMERSQFFEIGTTINGINEINIEGSTAFNNHILLCNRANLSTRKNHLLLWNRKESLVVKEMALPATKGIAGLSGLYYVREKDLLLFTASEEATNNTYEDGTIGDSYIGWITDFSAAWKSDTIKPDHFLKLTDFDKAFAGQKIESVCMESYSGNDYQLHLAADNDNGKSVLFKVKLTLQ